MVPTPGAARRRNPELGGFLSLIAYHARIHFADAVVEDALRPELKLYGIRRPVLVTDVRADDATTRGEVRNLILDEGSSRGNSIAVFFFNDSVDASSLGRLRDLVQAHDCDGLIALGSASALDLAKLVNHRAAKGKGKAPRLPLIVIPTCLTGGVGLRRSVRYALDEGGVETISNDALMPDSAFCDPILCIQPDRRTRASQGFDVVTHCIESFLNSSFNPPAVGIALEGMRRIAASLERAVMDGDDREAQREIMAAAINGALAEQRGLGSVHALAHALEGHSNGRALHGELHPALLGPVLKFNAPAVGSAYPVLAEALGLHGATTAEIGEALALAGERLGLPPTLGGLGLRTDDVEKLADIAARDHASLTNPRRVRVDDYRALLVQAT
jgi:4-hydroxybutyrate dehydrogenase